MKSLIITSPENDPLADKINKRHLELKELARRNAIHYAKRNQPSAEGDFMANYIGEFKAGYEELAALVLQSCQPGSQLPQAKMEHDVFKENDNVIAKQIKTLEDKIANDEYGLEDYNPGTLLARLWWIFIITFILMIGEVILNTKAFQVIGENMLLTMLLSFSVVLGIAILSHTAAFIYKAAKNAFQRRLTVIISLAFATIVFYVMAVLRSKYMQAHDVHIEPWTFVIINLFFFVISGLLSFFILPTWAELKENAQRLRIFQGVKKCKKKINQLEAERKNNKQEITALTQQRVRTVHHANYSVDALRKKYFETVEFFKRYNLTHRTDRLTPDCYLQIVPDLDVDDDSFHLLKK